MTHPDYSHIADTTAKILLDIKAVHCNAAEPFVLTSGARSPVYIDCRKIISFVQERQTLMAMAETVIRAEIGAEHLDAVAGGETAGIPFAAWLADRLALPMQYVRKKPKGFGRNAQIEGALQEGMRVLLVEDLTTNGLSKINFCEALRHAGAVLKHVFVLFHYDIFKESRQTLKAIDIELHALATWWDVLRVAKQGNYFDAATLDEVEKFLHAPAQWSAERGGKAVVAE